MPDQITNTLYLSIGTVNFATPAYDIKNIEVLLDGPDVRGKDRILPTAAGVKPYKRRATVSRRVLQMQIYGDADRTGTPASGTTAQFQQLLDNIAVVRTISDPVGTGDGTQTATLHFPNATTKTATVHVISPLQLRWVSHKLVNAVLTLELTAGSFA